MKWKRITTKPVEKFAAFLPLECFLIEGVSLSIFPGQQTQWNQGHTLDAGDQVAVREHPRLFSSLMGLLLALKGSSHTEVPLGWELLGSTDKLLLKASPCFAFPRATDGSTPSSGPILPAQLLERRASVSLQRGILPPPRLTALPMCQFPQPQVQAPGPTLGKDIALTPSGLPLPFGLHLLFLGKGLLRGRLLRGLSRRLRFVFPLSASSWGLGQRRGRGWRRRRWGRERRGRWRRQGRRLPGHVDDRFDGGHDGVLAGGGLQDKRAQTRLLTPFAGKVDAFFQHRHLVSGVLIELGRLLSGTPSPLLDEVVACLWLSLQPLGLQDLVHVVQVLLGGQNLGVVAHLPHLALDGFDLTPLESLLQGAAGCRRAKRRNWSQDANCLKPRLFGDNWHYIWLRRVNAMDMTLL